MRWPWHRERPGLSEATAARIRAEHELAKTRAKTADYRALGKSLRELYERNNLREALETSFRGGRP